MHYWLHEERPNSARFIFSCSCRTCCLSSEICDANCAPYLGWNLEIIFKCSFFFSSLMLVILLLSSPVLQDSTHLSDISSGSGHQYRLDQLGQPEPRLPAQWWGLQSLPSFLHLGLWPSHCHAGRSSPWGQFKGGEKERKKEKEASWDVSWLTLLPTLPGPLPPPFSFLFINGALRHKAVRGRLIPLSWHGHKLIHTHTNTRISVYIQTS